MTPGAYWGSVVVAGLVVAGLVAAARLRPGAWRRRVVEAIGTLLAADVVAYTVGEVLAGSWSARTSLPLALCNVGVLVAIVACFRQVPLLVELTYFVGLAGTLQAVLTPDLSSGFPHLQFFEYLVGHVGIVAAALFLVAGMGLVPRRRAVPRVFAVTAAYTALVGLVDALSGANYMFLRSPPGEWTLLRVLGPWPWYVPSAAGVALVLLVLLDLPFWPARRRQRRSSKPVATGG